MKVLLVVYTLGYADNIAIAYLSSIAKQSGHEVFFHTLDNGSLVEKIKEIKPDVVGYSANILGFDKLIEQNREARKIHNFVSIMGGPHPTFSSHTFNDSDMDAYCIGEGEYAFRDFLEKIKNKESFDDVENLLTKNGVNHLRPLIKNLDELPMPDRDLVIANSFLKDTSKKTFYTSRGCPFKCSYCCNSRYNRMYSGQRIIRKFSVDRVMREIKEVACNYRTDFIKFGDDLFASKVTDWLVEFADRYRKEINIPFNCYLRCDLIDDELLRILKYAGCYSVSMSVDSTSEYVRENVLQRNMSKKANLINNIRRVRDFGIHTLVNYMLAVPCSSNEYDIETIEWSRKANVSYALYTTATPMPGTVLHNYCLGNSLLDADSNLGNFVDAFDKKSMLNCFTEREKDIRYNVYLLGNLVAKLPKPLYNLGMYVIKHGTPNILYKKIRDLLHKHFIETRIYKVKK